MLPSKKLFCALEAVLYIAYNSGSGPISGRDIAARQNLPPRYLEQLMQKLVRAGVLRGVRGPNGGYLLSRERRRISIGDIYDVLADDKDDYTQDATQLGTQVILPVWQTAHQHMMDKLRDISLADLCAQASTAQIRKENTTNMDFVI